MSGLLKEPPTLLGWFLAHQPEWRPSPEARPIILCEEEAAACMQQWEYIIVDVRLWRSGEAVYINGHPVERLAPSPNRVPGEEDSAAPSLYEVLEWLGKNGWEMTGIAPDEHYSKLFFKRPRQPKTLPAPPPVARLTSGRPNEQPQEPLPRSTGKKTRGQPG